MYEAIINLDTQKRKNKRKQEDKEESDSESKPQKKGKKETSVTVKHLQSFDFF